MIGHPKKRVPWFENETKKNLARNIEELTAEIKRLKDFATKDELTEVYNRHGFKEEIGRVFANNERNPKPEPGAILIVDLDNFKKINDAYGHSIGDDTLLRAAKKLETIFKRKTDIIGRRGGDEFIVYADDVSARKIIKRFYDEKTKRARIDTGIDINALADKKEFKKKEKGGNILTFSIGISDIVQGEDFTSALDKADKALYRAKKEGKDRIEEDLSERTA